MYCTNHYEIPLLVFWLCLLWWYYMVHFLHHVQLSTCTKGHNAINFTVSILTSEKIVKMLNMTTMLTDVLLPCLPFLPSTTPLLFSPWSDLTWPGLTSCDLRRWLPRGMPGWPQLCPGLHSTTRSWWVNDLSLLHFTSSHLTWPHFTVYTCAHEVSIHTQPHVTLD